jgi:hypothetical protein
MTAHRISEIFGVRLTRKLRGRLATVIEQIEHGHHVFRVNFKNALLRQYEKYHGGTTVGGWTAKQIRHAVLAAFQLSAKAYGLNQLRYDLRKLKGHGLLQRDDRRYAYRLTRSRLPFGRCNRCRFA